MELVLSRDQCKMELGGLWEADLIPFLPCGAAFLN